MIRANRDLDCLRRPPRAMTAATSSAIAAISKAERMLEKATTIDEIRHVENLAQLARDYAKKARVAVYDFLRNKGHRLMQRYRISPAAAVIGSISRRKWCEWKFTRVPPGFWEVAENRHRYLRWVGQELGFRQPEDWYWIQTSDITGRHGSKLIHRYASLYDLMREFLPQLDWDQVDHHRPIQVAEILAWADAHHAKHGKWPTGDSGEIPGTRQTWRRIDRCLRDGFRGLPGRTSLARFLKEHRGVRIGQRPPDLSEKEILAWADAHFASHGKWPTENSGPIAGTRETWGNIASSMLKGGRGFRRGSSLAQLLARRRGVRNPQRLPPLREQKILAWARAHFKATGRWPGCHSGEIAQSSGDTWLIVDKALNRGTRGFQGGSSLAQLLARRLGVRNYKRLAPLQEQQILIWASAYFKATGRWPRRNSGPIAQSSGETWMAVATALGKGCRGLPGGSSLARLLRKHGLK